MKKIIKICLIIMLIILFLGITFSSAELKVTGDTGIEEMLEELNRDGGYLTGISDAVKDANDFLYCMERYAWLYNYAQYTKGETITYPGDGSDNGYARAYALAAPGYIKNNEPYGGTPSKEDERQWAWYYFEGGVSTKNPLIEIAEAYQKYKETTKDQQFELKSDNATTIVDGNMMIYGPIQIKYSYGSHTSGEKSDEWGGFYYSFFDESGKNIKDDVQLYILGEDKTYQAISNENVDGYYKVATSDYSNKDLYIITTNDTITKATMKLKENTVDYTAYVHELDGIAKTTSSGYNRCSECWENTTSSYTEAINDEEKQKIYSRDNKYYKYSGSELKPHPNRISQQYDRLILGGIEISTGIPSKMTTDNSYYQYVLPGGEITLDESQAKAAYRAEITGPHHDSIEQTSTYRCNYCNKNFPTSTSPDIHAYDHARSNRTYHEQKDYEVNYYYFTEYNGCGETVHRPKGSFICGDDYQPNDNIHSQQLLLIDTLSENKSTEIVFDLEIDFYTAIEVNKKWIDNNNTYQTRPSGIEVRLLANGTPFKGEDGNERRITLNSDNNWTGRFEELPIKDSNNKEITYTVEELTDLSGNGYEQTNITGNQDEGYTIINMLKTEVIVKKEWDDDFDGIENSENLDDIRPVSVNVRLYADGKDTGKTALLNESNNWIATFKDLYKCNSDGSVIQYTIKEEGIPAGYQVVYSEPTENSKGYITLVATNTHTPQYDGYIEISGKVWLDGAAGKGNIIDGKWEEIIEIDGALTSTDTPLEGIPVILKDANGKQFDATSTATTDENGNYTIKVNYDDDYEVYKTYGKLSEVQTKLNTAYVEFEYDGLKYTTIQFANTGENTSKAKENEDARNTFDSNHSTVTPLTPRPTDETWQDRKLTANTNGIIDFSEYADRIEGESEETVKYCECPNEKYEHTNITEAWGEITTEKPSSDKFIHTCDSTKTKVKVIRYQNINLGLFEREQPKIMITSDIDTVQVTMNNQKYTYIYKAESEKYEKADLKIKYTQRIDGEEHYVYSRPFNPADIAEIQNNPDALEVLVTYDVKVGNASTTLPITVDKIINVYDPNYTFVSAKIVTDQKDAENNPILGDVITKQITNESSYYKDKNDLDNEKYNYNEMLIEGLEIKVEPQNQIKTEEIGPDEPGTLKITYSVNIETIKEKLLQGKAVLENAVEIETYSTQYGEKTLYAEQRTGKRTEEMPNNPYAGYDYNSHPGNAGIYRNIEDEIILHEEKHEPDTHIAPSFALVPSEEASKTISGTVWEDLRDETREQDAKERLGNGKIDDGEYGIQNVKVELYKLIRDENGNIVSEELAKLYNIKEETKEIEIRDAVVYTNTDENGQTPGEYSLKGIVTGEYFLKFTYGNDESQLNGKKTTMDGTTFINARNNKSTTIEEETIIDDENNKTFRDLFGKNYANFTEKEKIWHITHNDGYSIAVDNMKERIAITDLQYDNFETPLNMTAYSMPFKTLVEFDADGEAEVGANGQIEGVSSNLNKMDFGIIERPREDLFVDKTITNISLELANGQMITDGNPKTGNLPFTKVMGFEKEFETGADARNALPKKVLIELDSELIQGSTLKIDYAVKVTNNNEIDYDYETKADGTKEEYSDIVNQNYITDSPTANYYYFGEKAGLQPLKTTITFVDYIDNELGYKEDSEMWSPILEDEIATEYNGIICNEGIDKVKRRDYQAFRSKDGAELILGVGDTFDATMSVSKVIANKEKINYDNNAEIVKIDGKTARTIQESYQKSQVPKSYKPGNLWKDGHEQDDGRVETPITSSTGITNYTTPYIISGLIGLIVILGAVIFIKKKVLIK